MPTDPIPPTSPSPIDIPEARISLIERFKKRVYFVPGLWLSRIIPFIPSFRLRRGLIALTFSNSAVHPTVTFHGGTRFLVPRNLRIGAGSTINSACLIDTRNPIHIGTRVMIGHGVKIFTLGHDIEAADFRTTGSAVHIEDNVIVFSDARIMPGVRIGSGAVVLNSALVSKDVPPMAVVGGTPAKVLWTRASIHQVDFNYRMFCGI